MKKLSRNDFCWCQSGIKYKKCHEVHDEQLKAFKRAGYPIPDRSLFKTKKEIEGIRKSCQLTTAILDQLNDVIKPGVTTNAINDWVHQYTLDHDATPAPLNYKGFPKSICTSINEVVCHGIPSDRKLIEGDIINVDVTCILDGYYGDSCRMYAVGTISDEAQKLIDITKECLYLAIEAIKPFESLNVVGAAIEDHAHKHGYSVIEVFGGHGIGKKFHEEPFVYHFRHPKNQMILAPNMTLTIEPMINAGAYDCKILKDRWTAVTTDHSLSAQWEHTVLITETGAEPLTES